MTPPIAIVGMACRYPDARSPGELWENVLAGRRAFRRLPPERLRLEDYPPDAEDSIYSTEAALLEGYEFDRVRFRVAGSTFRAADMAHWLALEVAADALADAGFAEAEGLPKEASGVLVGNSLTGEFSRANLMRLRWPYVRRVVDAALAEQDWSEQRRADFLEGLQEQYKSPFPPVGDETLAGGLSNTIAGRICNHFDLGGGGYTVDGACASSLLAVGTACSALTVGDLDVAVAGGVDLSLDPFELVGFAKLGALAREDMRVYDAHSTGFWPGEGCGFLVLMRHEDAVQQHRRIYAVVRGWGISSDGSGGITRPEVRGQLLALHRAYRRAGFGIETVPHFEGHGTGTGIGDSTELRTLSEALREGSPTGSSTGPPAAIGSIKANIGHTKAAAGAAGLIKATMALQNQLLPPSTGWEEPHPVLVEQGEVLRLLKEAEAWPADRPLRSGVSAMGFGGINAHIVLEGPAVRRRKTITSRERSLLSSRQDAELFLISAPDREALQQRVQHLASFASRLSRSELADLAAQLAKTLQPAQVRAAVVASNPAELDHRLKTLDTWLTEGVQSRLKVRAGIMLGSGAKPPSIGLLFPGQGTPASLTGGAWVGRFESVRELYARVSLPTSGDNVATEVAQPAIVTASLAGLQVLDQLGLEASVAIGHSLGELTAYHWANAMDEAALLRVVTARGRAIAEYGRSGGAMASIGAGQDEVEPLLHGTPVVLAGLNSPNQTVISGEAAAIEAVVSRAEAAGLTAVRLPVSHAFHSPMVADSTPVLAHAVDKEQFRPLQASIASTVTGTLLDAREDLPALLSRQMTSPVRFMEALRAIAEPVDLWIEVGPGSVMRGIAGKLVDTPIASLDAGNNSLRGLLEAVGAAFVLGAAVNHEALFADRFTRPFDLDWQPGFLVNPCERAPEPTTAASPAKPKPEPVTVAAAPIESSSEPTEKSLLEVVRELAAQRAELPLASVKAEDRLLNDLHLSSLAVGQLVVEASRALGLPPPSSPADAANATVGQVAEALAELAQQNDASPAPSPEALPAGVDSWTRAFTVELVESRLPPSRPDAASGPWRVIAPADHPLKDALQDALPRAGAGKGVAVCLPPQPDQRHIDLLLEAAEAVLADADDMRFLLVQHGGGAAAFARTLQLELPQVTTCVVDVPEDHGQAVEWILAEARAAVGYTETYYDQAGVRRKPVLCPLPLPAEEPTVPLDPDDVLLVSGGGKGIAAESAFSLAKHSGVRLALIGRSEPSGDEELAANLQRMKDAGVKFRYVPADVTDPDAVAAAVREVEAAWGPITAILHGAGSNVPRRLGSLDKEAFLRTLAPKVEGARNLLSAVNPETLRLFVTFGSIIARTGMHGQADYAVANEWLADLTERWHAEHPHCDCLAVEWSVWSGVGMGERLGTLEALKQQGITPIPPDEGVRMLRCLIGRSLPKVPVVVTGRFGEPPTLKLQESELPLLRFLERPCVHIPGVELVAEADLSTDTDPYLKDHVYQGEQLFPAVMGLEAMAQATLALTGCSSPPEFEDVQFLRPIVVPDGQRVTVRTAALIREPGRVEVVLRSQETGFQMDHFRAICRVDRSRQGVGGPSTQLPELRNGDQQVPIDPKRDLYGGILFHQGRFQRLSGYRHLRATECIADISHEANGQWFGQYLPGQLVLGDAAARDAVIHAIQACIPHGTLLPIGVDRLVPGVERTDSLVVRARERSREGKLFVYDLEVTTPDGKVLERWEGLRLQQVGQSDPGQTWIEPLLGPYIERRLGELVPGSTASVTVQRNGVADRRTVSDLAIQQTLGTPAVVHRRPDGRPEACCDQEVSVAHAGDLTMAVAGPGLIACDAEPVVARPEQMWRDLLGSQLDALLELTIRESDEDRDIVATRVWAAAECLKKAGAGSDVPVVFRSKTADHWVLFAAGPMTIATWVAPVGDPEQKLALAVLLGSNDASL